MDHDHHLRDIRARLERKQLALFIGGDLPCEITGLPNRADLARDLARHHGLDESISLAEAAQQVSYFEFTDFIYRALDPVGKSPQPFHQRIAALVQQHHVKTIITTAYDGMVEITFQQMGVDFNRVVRGSDVNFINPDYPTLIKLYGDVQQRDTLIVTDSDHLNLLRDRNKEAVLEEVRRALRLNTLLFIGYNLADPDFRFLFDQIAGSQFARTAYAVWPAPSDAQSKSMWENRGITILNQDPLGILDTIAAVDESPDLPAESTEIAEERASFTPPTSPAASEESPEQSPPPSPIQQKSLPQIDSNVRLSKLEETVLQHVHPNCEQVLVEAELSGGFSGAQVLLVVPKPKKDGPPKPRKVTKLGSAHEMRRERDKYKQYVDDYLPFCATRVEEDTYYQQEGLAGLNYVFVHDGITFEEYYRQAFDEGNIERVKNVLEDLLDKKLGYRWYQYLDPTPVFFRTEYSRQLVENLRLELRPDFPDRLGVLDKLPPSTEKFYTQLDLPVIYQQPETISPGDLVTFQGLVPTRIKHKEVTLEDADGRGIVIGVEFSPEMDAAQGLDFEHPVGVRGQVVYNRHAQMEKIVRAVFRGLKPGIGRIKGKSVRLPCGNGDDRSQVYPNPLQVYPDVLSAVLEARLSTVHGDLNLRNILVDESGKGWLIDFAKVERRHNVFDFIKLEARLRTSELSRKECAFSLCDYITFEETLNEAILDRSTTPPANPHLRFAYDVILTIRQIAQKYMGPNPDFRKEYFPALLLYCLGTMRYYKNDGKRSAQLAFATACVQGKYWQGADDIEIPAPKRTPPSWNTTAIRELITAAFKDAELNYLCSDYFPQVYQDFGSKMGKKQKIQRLLEHCSRHEQLDKLLELVKEHNPVQYEHFAPQLHQEESVAPRPPKGDGEPSAPQPTFGTGNRWAVLVGVDKYADETNYGRLSVCVNDAYAIHEQLIAGGFDPARVHLLTNRPTDESPTRANILTTLQAVANATRLDDLLLFYYSGHGDEKDSEPYLVSHDGQMLTLGDTAVSVSRIKEIMQAAPARAKVIILDACHSGADIGGKGSRPMSAGFIRRVFEQAKGLAILSSCEQGQLSYEWPESERSVFTHFLLKALAGEADWDEKGFVTVQDANRHVADGVNLWASQHKTSQTPTLQYTVAGDIILVYCKTA